MAGIKDCIGIVARAGSLSRAAAMDLLNAIHERAESKLGAGSERPYLESIAEIADERYSELEDRRLQALRSAVQSARAAKQGQNGTGIGQTGTAGGTQPAGKPSAGAGRRGEVGQDRGPPKPKPESVSLGGGSGAERSSVDEAVAKGDSLPAGQPGRGPEPAGSVPLAPRPATLFGPAEPNLVDKAGNIRLDNLTSSEDVKQAIREAAEANDDFIGDRRGVVTDGQVLDLADALGMTADSLNRRKIGQAFNAEQIMAARKLLVQSATNVSDLMKKAASGSDQDVLAYAMAKDRHQMIQAQVAGITAEAGRALRAFRNISEDGGAQAQAVDQFIKTATGKTLFQLREEAKLGAALDTPAKVSKMMADSMRPTFGRMLLEYWINGLISGPATHTTYMIGNLALAMEKVGPETALASLVGRARQAMGRTGDVVQLGEVGAQLRGAAKGFAPALKASAEAFRTGTTTLLPGEEPYTASLPLLPDAQLTPQAKFDESATMRDAMAASFGIVRGLRDGFLAGSKLLAAGGVAGEPTFGTRSSTLGVIPDLTFKGVNVAPVGTLVRAPGRFIAAIHSLFRSMNYSMEKSALAYRTAANEGLTGEKFNSRVADIWTNPSEQVMEAARSEATELTLMGKGSEFTQALSKLTNTQVFGFPILKFIDPFVHIASNVIDQSIIQRTPIGILAPAIRDDLMGRNGNIAQDKATARMLAGTALAVTFGGLAAEGYVSGSGPSDPRKSAMWRLAGNQAHSVRIGDMWYDVHRLGPLGMLMGMSADLYEVGHTAGQGDYLTAAATLQHAVTQNILDESFMKGPADLIQAIEDPGRYGQSYLRNFASSFVPYSVGVAQVDRATDPYMRQARTVIDAIRAKVPTLSEQLFPKRDIWGEPMPNAEALGAKGLTAVYERRMSTDPVNIEMVRLGLGPAVLERKIRNIDLTDQEYDDFSRLAGRLAKQRLDALVSSETYGMFSDAQKALAITGMIESNREAARGYMMARYPHIPQDAANAKRAKFMGVGN